jgi:hypothetical protein
MTTNDADVLVLAERIAASLDAVLPLLRSIQEHCGPGDHDEIIARAAENLKAYRALRATPALVSDVEEVARAICRAAGNDWDEFTGPAHMEHAEAAIATRDKQIALRRALSRPVPEGWVAAEVAPREWEGKLAWEYHQWSGEIKQSVIPPNYSRRPNHCAGVFFIPIRVPAAPAQRED